MLNQSEILQSERIIKYLYKFELMNEVVTSVDAFESGDYDSQEIKMIEAISKNYDKYKILITKFISSKWSWERLAPLLRAILICGAFKVSIRDRALVIDVIIDITKEYIPDDSYKFVNSVLDQIGDYYDKIKKS